MTSNDDDLEWINNSEDENEQQETNVTNGVSETLVTNPQIYNFNSTNQKNHPSLFVDIQRSSIDNQINLKKKENTKITNISAVKHQDINWSIGTKRRKSDYNNGSYSLFSNQNNDDNNMIMTDLSKIHQDKYISTNIIQDVTPSFYKQKKILKDTSPIDVYNNNKVAKLNEIQDLLLPCLLRADETKEQLPVDLNNTHNPTLEIQNVILDNHSNTKPKQVTKELTSMDTNTTNQTTNKNQDHTVPLSEKRNVIDQTTPINSNKETTETQNTILPGRNDPKPAACTIYMSNNQTKTTSEQIIKEDAIKEDYHISSTTLEKEDIVQIRTLMNSCVVFLTQTNEHLRLIRQSSSVLAVKEPNIINSNVFPFACIFLSLYTYWVIDNLYCG